MLRRFSNSSDIAIDGKDQSLVDLQSADQDYGFHTHEAALRAARELNRLGSGAVNVVKCE